MVDLRYINKDSRILKDLFKSISGSRIFLDSLFIKSQVQLSHASSLKLFFSKNGVPQVLKPVDIARVCGEKVLFRRGVLD